LFIEELQHGVSDGVAEPYRNTTALTLIKVLTGIEFLNLICSPLFIVCPLIACSLLLFADRGMQGECDLLFGVHLVGGKSFAWLIVLRMGNVWFGFRLVPR